MCDATAAPPPHTAPKRAETATLAQHVSVRLSVVCDAAKAGQYVAVTLLTTSKSVAEQPRLQWRNKFRATLGQLLVLFSKAYGPALPAATIASTHAANSTKPATVSCSAQPHPNWFRSIFSWPLYAKTSAIASQHEASSAACSTLGSSAYPAQPAAVPEPVFCTAPASALPPWTSKLRTRIFRLLFAQEAAHIQRLEGQLAAESGNTQQLEKNLSDQDGRIAQLQTALYQCVEQNKQLRESLHTVRSNIGLLNSNLDQAEEKIATLRSQLAEAQLAAHHGQSALERLDNAEAALAGAQQAVQQMQLENEYLTAELSDTQLAAAQRVQQLQEDVLKARSGISPKARDGLMQLSEKIKSQKAELTSITLEVVQLRCQLRVPLVDKMRYPVHKANVSL